MSAVPRESITVGGSTAKKPIGLDARLRRAFRYSDSDSDAGDDYNDAVLYMDEQSQEELIQELQKEDAERNRFYCMFAKALIASPSIVFSFRYLRGFSAGWVFNSDLFALISLVLSFCSAPKPSLRPEKIRPPPPGNLLWELLCWAQDTNIVASGLLCLWTWTGAYYLGTGHRPLSQEEYQCAIPFFMAVLAKVMRNMMLAVNFGELEHLRYNYKGA